MLTAENYISANAACVAENCVRWLLWENRPIAETINRSADHAADYFPGIASNFSAAVLDCLKKATESPAAFNKFINSRRKLLIRPYRRSAAEYIRLELETALTAAEIIAAVRRDMGV